jgi:GDP-D-mannose dehydratase
VGTMCLRGANRDSRDGTVETQSNRVRQSDINQVLGSPKKIRDATGWSAAIPLRKTIEDLLNHWRSKCAASVSYSKPSNGARSSVTL